MKKINIVLKSVMVFLMMLSMFSCKQEELSTSLNLDVVNKSIMNYLKGNSNYSTLVEALDISGVGGTLNLYGQMTLFAPPNSAFEKFFTRKGITGLSDMNIDTLARILKYHIYSQKFGAELFQTGSLPAVTVSGDLIKMDISQGLKNVYLNDNVKIDTVGISVTNGIVHVVNDILEPSSFTIYSYLAANPKYSIMALAIHNTGVDTALLAKVTYDNSKILNGLPPKLWITAFIEPDSILKLNGINSFDDLAAKYSNTYNTTKSYSNLSDSLNVFVRYHCMQQKFFISDFTDTYLESKSFGNWMIFSTKGGMSINKHDINVGGTIVPYSITIDLNNSNLVMNNGIVHSINSILSVYNPAPITVNSYFGGAPEDKVIKLLNGTVTTFSAQVSNLNNKPTDQAVVWWLKWGNTAGTFSIASNKVLQAGCNVPNGYSWNPLYKYDFLVEAMDGIRGDNSNKGVWLELTTKAVFKGKYTLYVYEQQDNVNIVFQNWKILWTFDGVQAPDMIDLMQNKKDAYGNEVRLVNEMPYDNLSGNKNNQYVWNNYNYIMKRKLGVYTFTQIQSHKFKVTYVDDLNILAVWQKITLEPTP